MYNIDMIKRTTVNLNMDLVSEAARVLGTKKVTDTLHRSLEDIVRRERIESLLSRDLSYLTPEMLNEMREPRFLPDD